jgi:hypothetical protein
VPRGASARLRWSRNISRAAFPTLESIYRFDPGVRQARLQFEDLGVVWRYDEDVGVSGCSSLSRLIEVGFVAMTYSASFGHMPAGKAEGSDRFLEILGSAERDLLTGLDLDGFASRRVASHAGGAMPDLQDAQAHQA